MFWLPAFLMSLCAAGIKLTNEKLCLSAAHLQLWRAIIALAILLPVVCLAGIPAPTSLAFYAFVGLNAAIVSYTDIRVLNGVRGDKFGAGVIARLGSLTFVGSFAVWMLLDADLRATYWANPVLSLGIVLCIGTIMACLWRLRSDAVTWSAARYMLPVVLAGSFIPIFNKLAVESAPLHVGPYWYPVVMCALMVPLMLIRLSLLEARGQKAIGIVWGPDARNHLLWGAFITAVLWCLYAVAKGYAMVLTPNPAYIEAIDKMVPVWIMLANTAMGVPDKGHRMPGFIMVAAVVALVLLGAAL